MVIFNFVKNQVVPGFTRRHNDLDRLVRELGPVFLELIRRASKNPRVLNWLSFLLVFVGIVTIKKLFNFFFRSSNS
jgi:hypothetical protein